MKAQRKIYANIILVFIVFSVWRAFAQPTSATVSQVATTRNTMLEPGQSETNEPSTSTTAPVHAKEWSSPEVELRGIWLPGRELLESTETIQRKLDGIASAHFNAVFPDVYFKGYVIYPDSRYLPQLPEAQGRDPLKYFIEEAHKRGLEVHAWLEYGFYSYHTPDATKDKSMGPWLDAHPELLSVSSKGDRFIHNPAWGDFYSMCPSNPQCHELIAGIASEVAQRYEIEGINLDRIRYAGENYCYCDYCKEHFKKETGLELSSIEENSATQKRFLEWKREQLVKAVRTIREKVKAVRQDIVLTSYVVPPEEKDNKAQPWDLWAKHRLLDAIAVSMYGQNIVPPAERAVKILGPDRDILVAAISCEVSTSAYVSNIEKARQYSKLGQITWYSGKVEDDLEALRNGPYARPARSPFQKKVGNK
jgi:uncharacterized lipoprotein YddW (UPF0748 family)